MFKRVWRTLLSVLVVSGMLLAACAPKPVPTEAPAPPPTEAPAAPPTEAPPAPPEVAIDCMGAASGDEVAVLYQWSGAEEEKFNAVVKPLVDACGKRSRRPPLFRSHPNPAALAATFQPQRRPHL